MSADIIQAENLTESHPELPPGFRRHIGVLQAHGWPWACETCRTASFVPWKCSACGRPWP